jgi:P27 family predicted phage terminase small subunit
VGLRGPKPTPKKILKLRGSWRSKLNSAEPDPPPAAPDCPAHLDEESRREWARVVPLLQTLELLTDIDRAALAAYCQCWSRWVKAEQEIAKFGAILVNKTNQTIYPSPWLAVSNKMLQEMRRYLAEFGMTPSSRSRVSTTKEPSKAKDGKSRFFKSA